MNFQTISSFNTKPKSFENVPIKGIEHELHLDLHFYCCGNFHNADTVPSILHVNLCACYLRVQVKTRFTVTAVVFV